ncbi:1,4-dihydroxy-2-naphthoyl-CoA thioesterase 1 [Hordeum vulgare]|nr:1,4-dihydroxy-2-naphthoyl-CoA thioesterase 1 [Hordeum vulgare]
MFVAGKTFSALSSFFVGVALISGGSARCSKSAKTTAITQGRDTDGTLRRNRENFGGAASGPPPGFGEGAPPDNALHALGFEYTRITGSEVLGRLASQRPAARYVSCARRRPKSAVPNHPFKMLNGGVSALIAESSASIGGYMASGLGGPDMAVGPFHIGAQRFGIISKGYPVNQLVNTRANEEL